VISIYVNILFSALLLLIWENADFSYMYCSRFEECIALDLAIMQHFIQIQMDVV
jgi:hypothetical protein